LRTSVGLQQDDFAVIVEGNLGKSAVAGADIPPDGLRLAVHLDGPVGYPEGGNPLAHVQGMGRAGQEPAHHENAAKALHVHPLR
jgi:hypothetical protein